MSNAEKNIKKEDTQKSNVLPFPVKRMVRLKASQKYQERKAIFGLSILSILVFTIAINQWVSDFGSQNKNVRNVASFKEETKQDILSEHSLAQRLSLEKELAGLKAQSPSLRDELLFSVLEGQYNVQTENKRIKSVQNINSPVYVKDADAFVKKYMTVFNDKVSQFKKITTPNLLENELLFELIDQKGLLVETLKLSFNEKNQLLEAKVESIK